MSEAAVRKSDQEIAKEAYIYLYPTVETYKVMHSQAVLGNKAPFNTFYHAERLLGPNDTDVVSPNNDTVYSIAWLDLRASPMVLSVPEVKDGRYYSVQVIDGFTYNMAILSPRTTGSRDAARYVFVKPNWSGSIDTVGINKVFIADSAFVLVLVRTQVFGEDDFINVQLIQKGYNLQPLIRNIDLPPTNFPVPPYKYLPEDPEFDKFFTCANFMLQYLIIDSKEELQMLEEFKRIGVGPGMEFTLTDDIFKGAAEGWKEIDEQAQNVEVTPSGWSVNDPDRPLFGTKEVMQGRYLDRAVGARMGLYGLDPEEAVYKTCYVYVEGGNKYPLDSRKGDYVLHFNADELPTVNPGGFWSISLYSLPKYQFVENEINRYSIGDRTPGVNPDKPLTIYIQASKPTLPDQVKYWLPAPNGEFVLFFRLYWGKDPYVYSPPAVRKVAEKCVL